LLLTTIPFANNFFYVGSENVFIVSFSDWRLLTTLPMANGLAYMLCEIMIGHKMNIGEQHEENIGCISDFLWDKKGIDIGMRAAFLCDNCRALSAGNSYLESREFADTISILNAVSYASRRGADILSELPRTGAAELNISDGKSFDAFLCHNS